MQLVQWLIKYSTDMLPYRFFSVFYACVVPERASRATLTPLSKTFTRANGGHRSSAKCLVRTSKKWKHSRLPGMGGVPASPIDRKLGASDRGKDGPIYRLRISWYRVARAPHRAVAQQATRMQTAHPSKRGTSQRQRRTMMTASSSSCVYKRSTVNVTNPAYANGRQSYPIYSRLGHPGRWCGDVAEEPLHVFLSVFLRGTYPAGRG